jgi:hypothetical protein
MSDEAERLSQIPGREGVGGITLMDKGNGADYTLVR